jgi:hypothetical protein
MSLPRRKKLRILTTKFVPPEPPKVKIGWAFTDPTTGERWRITDVGTRTFLAVCLSDPKVMADPSWLEGPPYAVPEHVWEAVWDETGYAVLHEALADQLGPCAACPHPPESRLGFFPSSTDGGHERCTACGGIRYQQRRDGPWWPWQRQESVEDEEARLAR